ncbi:hypothetical protein NH340_JMT08815 [Sarcoptes scabiei]|nr:hypothetical protein NH340_JMT08815 [Sarcoptes scabiei]
MELFEFKPYRIVEIEQIFHCYFKFHRYYLLRFNYSLIDYQHKQLNLRISNLKFLLWCCLRAWISFLYLWILTLFPDAEWILSQNFLFKIIDNLNGVNVLFVYVSIIILWVEHAWFQAFRSLLNYSLKLIENVLIVYDDRKYTSNNRQHLLRYFIIFGYISGTIYRLFAICIVLCYLIIVLNIPDQYEEIENKCSVFSYLIVAGITINHLIYLTGLCFTVFFCCVFTCDLLLCQFKQLKQSLRENCSNQALLRRRSISMFIIEFLHRKFRDKYSEIFVETSNINEYYRRILFLIEMLSQITMIFLIIFYAKQKQISFYCLEIFITITPIFLMTTLIYSRISHFDSDNIAIYEIINSWSAKMHLKLSHQKLSERKMFSNQNTKLFSLLKLHHFNQSLANNRLGFTCGQFFYINKNRYAELLIMNIIFVMLFYKKLILNNIF